MEGVEATPNACYIPDFFAKKKSGQGKPALSINNI